MEHISDEQWQLIQDGDKLQQQTISDLRTQLAAARKEATQSFHASPAFDTYCDLKFGDFGKILSALQDGLISRSKAAEALAELMHGGKPSFAAGDPAFAEDEFPCEVVTALRAQLAKAEADRRTLAGQVKQMRGALQLGRPMMNRINNSPNSYIKELHVEALCDAALALPVTDAEKEIE